MASFLLNIPSGFFSFLPGSKSFSTEGVKVKQSQCWEEGKGQWASWGCLSTVAMASHKNCGPLAKFPIVLYLGRLRGEMFPPGEQQATDIREGF